MPRPFFIILFLLLAPLALASQSIWTYASDAHTFDIHVDTTIKDTEYDYVDAYYSIKKVEITSPTSPERMQTIVPLEAQEISTVYDSSLAVKLVDANFDGIVDLEVRDQPMVYLSTSHFWLYNAETRQFQADTFLAKLYGISFLPEQKMVHSYYHIGVSEFGHSLWQWQDGKLVMVISETVMDNMHDGGDDFYLLEVRSGNDMIEVDLPNPFEFNIPPGEEIHLYELYLKYK